MNYNALNAYTMHTDIFKQLRISITIKACIGEYV